MQGFVSATTPMTSSDCRFRATILRTRAGSSRTPLEPWSPEQEQARTSTYVRAHGRTDTQRGASTHTKHTYTDTETHADTQTCTGARALTTMRHV
eukprot:15225002-Alexandrium_andersonii.AAC.1